MTQPTTLRHAYGRGRVRLDGERTSHGSAWPASGIRSRGPKRKPVPPVRRPAPPGSVRGPALLQRAARKRKTRRFRRVPSAPERIRTSDLRFRRPTLYPAELRALAASKGSGARPGCPGSRFLRQRSARRRYRRRQRVPRSSRQSPPSKRSQVKTCAAAKAVRNRLRVRPRLARAPGGGRLAGGRPRPGSRSADGPGAERGGRGRSRRARPFPPR
jgi:hypothetical protein